MNTSKITNKVATATVVLLVYWVFIFVCIQVFEFKVFRENLTQIFGLSILGIFAVLSGAIVLNVMHNLTAIAERYKDEKNRVPTHDVRKKLLFFLGSLVVILAFLFIGDLASSKREETRLAAAAKALVDEQKNTINRISGYSFTSHYLADASAAIKLISKIDENFPIVTAIVRDKIDGKTVLLCFRDSDHYYKSKEPLQKVDFILSTSAEERKYLNSIFDGKEDSYQFSSNDGSYEIYYPVKSESGVIVLHLSEFNRYGGIGS